MLSLGYPTPLLGVLTLGTFLHELLPDVRSRRWEQGLALGLAVCIGAGSFALNYRMPYRDASRDQLTHDLGRLFPSLSGIRTNEHTFQRYRELRQLVRVHALEKSRPFVVTQDYPGIHWLLSQRSPWRIAWTFGPEPTGFEPLLFDDLKRSGALAIVPKDADAPVGRRAEASPCTTAAMERHNVFSQHVARFYRLVEETWYFCAYEPLQATEDGRE
jgi:hypothetical protein